MSESGSLSKRLRYEILRRDDFTCQSCGRSAPQIELHVDHVLPRALGGTDEPGNLRAACADCNTGKTSLAPDAAMVDQVRADQDRLAAAMRLAAQRQMADHHALQVRLAAFHAAWTGFTYSESGAPIELPDSWAATIEGYIAAGVEQDFFEYAIGRAMAKNNTKGPIGRFKYFCGIIRNTLQQRAEIAGELLAEAPAPNTDQAPAAVTELPVPDAAPARIMLRRPRQLLSRDEHGRVERLDPIDDRGGDFTWGYAGSGPLTTARAILAEVMDVDDLLDMKIRWGFVRREGWLPEEVDFDDDVEERFYEEREEPRFDALTWAAQALVSDLLQHLDADADWDIDTACLARWTREQLPDLLDTRFARRTSTLSARDLADMVREHLDSPPTPSELLLADAAQRVSAGFQRTA